MERRGPRQEFAYSKGFFLMRAVLVIMIVGILIMLMSYFSFLSVWSVITLAALLLYLIIVGISPLFTNHWVTLTRLVLRQGLYFKLSIPYVDIESVSATNELAKYGVRSSWLKDKVFIASSQRGLVSIRLKSPLRLLLVLGKSVREIVVSVNEPEMFIGAIREKMQLLAPVDTNGSYAEFGH